MPPTRPAVCFVVFALLGCGPGGAGAPTLPLRDVALGSEGACALDGAGAVWCWGNSTVLFPGELAQTGSENTCAAPFVSAGPPSVFGACISPAPMKPRLVNEALAGSKAVKLSVAAAFGLCVLTEEGKVWCGPTATPGSCAQAPCEAAFTVTSGDLVISQFDTNSVGWCGLTTDGAAWCFVGRNTQQKLLPVPGGQAFTRISTGAFSYLAVDAAGTGWLGSLETTGGELVPSAASELATGGATLKDAQVSAQYWVTLGHNFEANLCLLETGGAMTCKGWNTYGQLGNGLYRAAGGGSGRVTGLLATEVAVGSTHVCSLSDDGAVWCWGSSWDGELGAPTGSTRCDIGGGASIPCSAQPLRVLDLEPAKHVWAGINFSCAETRAGALRCWGSNATGQLGNDTGLGVITTTIGP